MFVFTCLQLSLLIAHTGSLEMSSPEISQVELEAAITENRMKVDEFRFIRERAEELGVRVYLFGGTAAGYAHYVKWELQKRKGDQRLQNELFDYEYSNIFRSTQDADLVMDGNAEQLSALLESLKDKFPHLQGSKTAWEIRLLKEQYEDKVAILNNPDFLNQHTDSNSVGLIELTEPKQGEPVVRDVRSWNERYPPFFEDVRLGKLHFYFSKTHEKTSRAMLGLNPPIFSVIRYLTKAFQYELQIDEVDRKVIQSIIDEFNAENIVSGWPDQSLKWIEKNAKKLIQHAMNIEYAVDVLNEMGLRKKLTKIRDNVTEIGSLSWWLNREPLRSKTLGQGTGKTAKELKLDIVAHDTRDFLAYESITRSHTGEPNALVSRNNYPGEAAIYGDGFYVRLGRVGAVGSGISIRFNLNPMAREGTDFLVVAEDFLVILNRQALEVIPEGASIGAVDYFNMILDGGIEKFDEGIRYKLKRRMRSKLGAMTDAEIDSVLIALDAHIDQKKGPMLLLWSSINEIFESLSQIKSLHPRLELSLKRIVNRDYQNFWYRNLVLGELFTKDWAKQFSGAIQMLFQDATYDLSRSAIRRFFGTSLSENYEDQLLYLMELLERRMNYVEKILEEGDGNDLHRLTQYKYFITHVKPQDVLGPRNEQTVASMREVYLELRKEFYIDLADNFAFVSLSGMTRVLKKLIDLKDPEISKILLNGFFAYKRSVKQKGVLEDLLSQQEDLLGYAIENVFSGAHSAEFIDILVGHLKRDHSADLLISVVRNVLSKKHSKHMTDLIPFFVEAGEVVQLEVLWSLISEPESLYFLELIAQLLRGNNEKISRKVAIELHQRDHFQLPQLEPLREASLPSDPHARAVILDKFDIRACQISLGLISP